VHSGGVEAIDVDGLRVAYERVGDGPPVVLLHGYVGDGPTTWQPQIDELRDSFDVIAWDAPGAGRSDDPPEDFGMAGYAACLSRFIELLGVAPAHVVGLSFGGAMAIELCRRHPELAATVTLAGAYAGWAGSLSTAAAMARLEQALRISALTPDEFVATLLPTMFSTQPAPDVVEAFGESIAAFHPAGFRAMARALAEDLGDALPHVSMPALLIYGANDSRAPSEVAEHLRQNISGAQLVVLPAAGHVCNLEDPEGFNRALRGFLERHRQRTPR
jgi:pimeloyl-ACP methyl ester carboxylesterase